MMGKYALAEGPSKKQNNGILFNTMGEPQNILITKANGEQELFDPFKLQSSLMQSGASSEVADQVVSHIVSEVKNGMTTSEIYRHAFDLLKIKERKTALNYSLRRAINELGPSGFPFEKFIAAIYHSLGYETLTGVILKGHCIEHEMDVVAWKDNELIFIEAKFHNAVGIKSDTKVVLYVKSRFEDLLNQTFTFGGKERKMTQGVLITNTKFTRSALHYAQCNQMNLIGWSYPPKNNLRTMIETSGLHPLTCLTTLTGKQKKQLLDEGAVLSRTLLNEPSLFKKIGMSEQDTHIVLEEIKMLYV